MKPMNPKPEFSFDGPAPNVLMTSGGIMIQAPPMAARPEPEKPESKETPAGTQRSEPGA